jgi:hypothetical protein
MCGAARSVVATAMSAKQAPPAKRPDKQKLPTVSKTDRQRVRKRTMCSAPATPLDRMIAVPLRVPARPLARPVHGRRRCARVLRDAHGTAPALAQEYVRGGMPWSPSRTARRRRASSGGRSPPHRGGDPRVLRRRPMNIGGLNGAPSGKRVDIDWITRWRCSSPTRSCRPRGACSGGRARRARNRIYVVEPLSQDGEVRRREWGDGGRDPLGRDADASCPARCTPPRADRVAEL